VLGRPGTHLAEAAGLLHVDETPARIEDGLAYVHVACNSSYTALHTSGRSAADIDVGGVLPEFAGCWWVTGAPACLVRWHLLRGP
jgi:hypothetical protein